MKAAHKWIIGLTLALASAGGAWGAAVIVAIERTTMPDFEWNIVKNTFTQYEAVFATYAEGDGFRLEVAGEEIRFIYDYADGLNYEFYKAWKDEYLAEFDEGGADLGYTWRVYMDGELSEESNPWNQVDWFPDTDVVDGHYLVNDVFGWLFAEDWSTAGGFWAYAYNAFWNAWLYVAGDGYYFDYESGIWRWNAAGTEWFYEFREEEPSEGEGGLPYGYWLYMGSTGYPRIAALDEIVIDEMIKQNLPGLAVGVAQDDEIVHLAGYGVTDVESPHSYIEPTTVIRWASISKPVTALATFQLANQYSNFAIDDLVTEHVPYWYPSPDVEDSYTTLRHLLEHSSGIHHYGRGIGANTIPEEYADANDPDGFDAVKAVDVFAGTGVDFFPPGSQFLYSTFAYNLLGAAVDEASPAGYVPWVMDNIADPASMTSLAVSTGPRTGYQRSVDGVLNHRTIGSVEWKVPGGGWESNIIDLTRFAQALATGVYGGVEAGMWMSAPVDPDFNYRLGVEALGSGDTLRVWHGGSHSNVRTLFMSYPNIGYAIAVMIPAGYANQWRILRRIRAEMGVREFDGDISPVDPCQSGMGSSDALFAGIWQQTDQDVIIRRGYSHSAFYREWKFLRENGYFCDDFEVHNVDGEMLWDGVFREGPGANGMWRGMTEEGLVLKVEAMAAIGQELVDLEVYDLNGTIRFAGLWRPVETETRLVLAKSTGDFATERSALAQEGFQVVDIEPLEHSSTQGNLRWYGLFKKRSETLLNRGYTGEDFYNLFMSRASEGWRLMDIEAYPGANGFLYAGIWEKRTGGSQYFYDQKYCDFMDRHDFWSGRGYELLDMEYYGY